jgi:hypothetical protein
MHGLLAAQLAPQNLDRPIADHLVRVHIALRAAPSLENHQWEMVDEFPRNHFVRGLRNCFADFGVQPVGRVHLSRGLFEDPQGFDEWWGKTLSGAANIKVHEGAMSQMNQGIADGLTVRPTVGFEPPSKHLPGPGALQMCLSRF